MTRALAASRSHWWGREPAQDWAHTSVVVEPEAYRDVLDALGSHWGAECSLFDLPATEWVCKARDVVHRIAPRLWGAHHLPHVI